MKEGTLLWQPTDEQIRKSNMSAFRHWLQKEKNLTFDSYDELWQWSVSDIESFWGAIWRYFDLRSDRPWQQVADRSTMPGTKWFTGAEINFAQHLTQRIEQPAIIFRSERHAMRNVSREELLTGAAAVQQFLIESGVKKGDRVAACMPNAPETVMAFIAVSAMGAIWSCCSPDFGAESAIDRFRQIDPKVLIATDGYSYGGKNFDRMGLVGKVQIALPTLARTVVFPFLNDNPDISGLPKSEQTILWTDIVEPGTNNSSASGSQHITFTPVPFDHPLWILYSSGTTGLPKPITHSHGGMLIEQLKYLHLHADLKQGDRFFWFTTTGWMMWNVVISALLCGGTAVLYDGSPGWPDMNVLWEYASESKMTYFGTSAAFLMGSRKAGVEPSKKFDLGSLSAVGSTGSPLPPEGYEWVYRHIGSHILLNSTSGGTDVCSSFVNGNPTLPVYAGEIQCRTLGASVEVYDDDGNPVINQAGEMVITKPMPCMPVCFWGDDDGSRYRESYFEHFPGVWRHGDLMKITDRGTCVIYGRSDATLNRMGVRIGTSEIYRAVEVNKKIRDSLIVSIEYEDGSWYMPLFVVPADAGKPDNAKTGETPGKASGNDLLHQEHDPLNVDQEKLKQKQEPSGAEQEKLKQEIVASIRDRLSPKFIPDEIHFIDEIPYTLNGKKMEKPVRKIMEGHKPEDVASLDSAKNPDALRQFVHFRRRPK